MYGSIYGQNAKEIYIHSSSGVASGNSSSKIVAGILAILLGGLGVHKFYLGCTAAGIVMLLVFVFGFILLGFPSLIYSSFYLTLKLKDSWHDTWYNPKFNQIKRETM